MGTAAAAAFLLAAAAGLLHAVASAYWALGGRWQLASVGDWAVSLADERPVTIGLALGVIALLKACVAVLPWIAERVHGRFHRQIRVCSWGAGGALLVWGSVSAGSAVAVLTGVILPAGGYDRTAMIGHALVWDPLFTVWGAALLTGLWLTRTPSRPAVPPTRTARFDLTDNRYAFDTVVQGDQEGPVMVSVQGSTPEGSNDFLVFVDDLPSSGVEDAPTEVWAEAQTFYEKHAFELVGTFDGSGQRGYRFSAAMK